MVRTCISKYSSTPQEPTKEGNPIYEKINSYSIIVDLGFVYLFKHLFVMFLKSVEKNKHFSLVFLPAPEVKKTPRNLLLQFLPFSTSVNNKLPMCNFTIDNHKLIINRLHSLLTEIQVCKTGFGSSYTINY